MNPKPSPEVAEALARLRPLPASDRERVFIATDEHDLTAGIIENVRAEAVAHVRDGVVVPAELREAHARSAFVENAIEAAARVVRGEERMTFAEAFPELAGQHEKSASACALKLPQAQVSLLEQQSALATHDERRRLVGELAINPLPLREELARTRLQQLLLLVVEIAALVPSIAAMLGLSDQPTLSAFDIGKVAAWTVASGFATKLLASFGGDLLFKAEKRGDRVIDEARLLRLGLVAFFGLVILLVGANAAVRVGAVKGDNPHAVAAAAVGLMVLSLLAVLAVLIALVGLRIAERRQKDELTEVERDYELESRTLTELEGNVVRAEAEVHAQTTELARIETIRAAFDSAVMFGVGVLREYMAVGRERVARAVAAYRYLATLASAVRSAVIRHAVDATGPTPARVRGRSALGGLLSALLLGIAGSSLGCTDTKPDTWVVVCDASASDDSACNHEVLSRLFAAWASVAQHAPGSRFVVVVPSNSYATTVLIEAARVPERYEGSDPRAGRREWLAHGWRAVAAVPLSGADSKSRENWSDLVDAVLVAYADTRAHPCDQVKLMLATDGLHVGAKDGLNFERRVPSFAEVKGTYAKKGVTFEMPPNVRSVALCGFGPNGIADAATALARERFWLALSSSPSVMPGPPVSSCRAVGEAPSARLLSAVRAAPAGE